MDYEPVQSGTNPVEFVINPLAEYINIEKTASTLSTSYLNVDKNPDIFKDYHTETDFLTVLCLSASFSERWEKMPSTEALQEVLSTSIYSA